MPGRDVHILSPHNAETFIPAWYELACDSHFWMQGRLFALLKQFRLNNIPVTEPLKGLEIGCGHGVLRAQIEKHTGWVVDGVDLDLASLKDNPPCRGDVYLYNIFDRLPDMKERYDFILLYDVIEHIDQVREFLAAACFHVKPGGYVFLNVPALESLFSNYDTFVGHVRRYDKKSMRATIEQADLNAIHVNYWGLTFVPMLWLRKHFLSGQTNREKIVQKGFSPRNSLVNAALKVLIRVEVAVCPNPFLGTSVMAIAQKKA